MNEIEKLATIIKANSSYSAELDGYVLNPTTVACKILDAGYRKIDPEKLPVFCPVCGFLYYLSAEQINQDLELSLHTLHPAKMTCHTEDCLGHYKIATSEDIERGSLS